MKAPTFVLRFIMFALVFMGVATLLTPVKAKAEGCFTNIHCLPADKVGRCGAIPSQACTCFFDDGTSQFDPIDCALL